MSLDCQPGLFLAVTFRGLVTIIGPFHTSGAVAVSGRMLALYTNEGREEFSVHLLELSCLDPGATKARSDRIRQGVGSWSCLSIGQGFRKERPP